MFDIILRTSELVTVKKRRKFEKKTHVKGGK